MSDNNVSNFIKKIEELNNSVTVYIPSRKKNIQLPPLNLKQQKDIISSVANGVAGLVGFTRILNNIITELSGDNTLMTYDRVPVIVALRVNALGNKHKEGEVEIDLDKVLEKIKNSTHNVKESNNISYKGVEVEVEVPSLVQENHIVKKLEEEVKKNGEDNTKNLGSIYVYEIAKYIKSVKINDMTIDYRELKISEKIQLIEALPLALNKQIVSYIEDVKNQDRELLTVDTITFDITPNFFDAE